ncbi:MAG: 1-deoxy-D-xylulose-5-phosphate synthase [Defluviitaleaceae bacterium]|nr:1-deoxy-D-xylulose-5-phosphate synthase [Defluviitaleaceae bacterium]
MTLEKLRSTKSLKKLSASQLQSLADEIREFLIHSISATGGHLASNLGVVELTLALHAIFQTPQDKIVWDVGHQAYVHKILTGRKAEFANLRKQNGLSGFPKPTESPHDAFGTGHSSTAISAALGLATARDALGLIHKVAAVIGDGSITGGLAYEGLNNAGRAKTDLLVILNDNQMSISKNVGAVARHLNTLRTTQAYLGAKEDMRSALKKLPVIGAPLFSGIEAVRDRLKYAILPGVLFEEMGFKYIGPIDGHDIPALLKTLRQIKNVKGPVLLHTMTTKGKGYDIAEQSPRSYHGVGKFDINTGEPISATGSPSYTDVFAKALLRKASRDEKVVAVTAAMADGVGLSRFKERFPKRFYDVGIAEGHAVTFAAGLAAGGLKPVVAVYSSFLQRAYDQIVHDVAVQNLPVVFAIDHAGAVAGDGETHQGIYDIAFLSHIPNMTILAPSTGKELTEMLDYAFSLNAPVAIRYPKDDAPEDIPLNPSLHNNINFQYGKKIAIVSVGAMLPTARAVADILEEKGHAPALFNAGILKPICEHLMKKLEKYDYVFTIEDGIKIGGFGERLKSTHTFAFPDIFPQTGTREELFTRHHMDAISIVKKILEATTNGKQKKA